MDGLETERLLTLYLRSQRVLGALVLLALSIGSLAEERERRTLDLLRATRVSTGEIVLSKLAASWVFVGFVLIATLPGTSLFYLLGRLSIERIVAAIAVNGAILGFVATVGIAAAASFANARHAALRAGLASVVLLFVLDDCVPVHPLNATVRADSSDALFGGLIAAALVLRMPGRDSGLLRAFAHTAHTATRALRDALREAPRWPATCRARMHRSPAIRRRRRSSSGFATAARSSITRCSFASSFRLGLTGYDGRFG